MIYGGKDLWNRCVLSLEWKREEVMDGVMFVSDDHSFNSFLSFALLITPFKDILFQISLSVLLATCHDLPLSQCALILLETSALYKLLIFTYLLLTYLLTY